jgi:hypothetical protein
MKAVRIILYVLGALVLLLLLAVIIAPTKYHVERTVEIDAPEAVVFEQMVPFPNFHIWSPWTDRDPDMEVNFSEKQGVVGATYSWSGNKEAGRGMQEIVAISGDTVLIELTFAEPFESTAESYYIITQIDSDPPTTSVAWGMRSAMPRPLNVIGWLMNIESAIGDDYDEGLSRLKQRVEGMDWEEDVAEEEAIENEDRDSGEL